MYLWNLNHLLKKRTEIAKELPAVEVKSGIAKQQNDINVLN